MIRKMLGRALVSAPICMLINQLVGICISLGNGDGRYSPVTPAFAARFDGTTQAVIVQLLLIGLVGATFAACSVIFEMERWSYLKQGLIHLAVTSVVAVPVCLYCWLPETREGALSLVGGWLFCYVSQWLSQYLVYRQRIRRLNEKIQSFNQKGTDDERDRNP